MACRYMSDLMRHAPASSASSSAARIGYAIVRNLREPERTLTLLAAGTGLRISGNRQGRAKNILSKLGANDRTQAAMIGLKRGIIEL